MNTTNRTHTIGVLVSLLMITIAILAIVLIQMPSQQDQKKAVLEANEAGYISAIWDAYLQRPQYMVIDTHDGPQLWKHVEISAADQEKINKYDPYKPVVSDEKLPEREPTDQN